MLVKISFDLDHGRCLKIVRNCGRFTYRALVRLAAASRLGTFRAVLGAANGRRYRDERGLFTSLGAALYERHLPVQATLATAGVVGLLRVHIEQQGLTAFE